MDNKCLETRLKGEVNNIAIPYFGGISCRLIVTATPKRLTINTGRVSSTELFEVAAKIEGNGYFTDSNGANLGTELALKGESGNQWYVASGEAYLHISPISSLGVKLALNNTYADFDIAILKDYEREDNIFTFQNINVAGTYVYGRIEDLPDNIRIFTTSKYITGDLSSVSNSMIQVNAYSGNIASFEYKGSRKGAGVNLIMLSEIELGADFDKYITDCAECDYVAGDVTTILVYGSTSYDENESVRAAVSAVYEKGVKNIYLIDKYGNRRRLG